MFSIGADGVFQLADINPAIIYLAMEKLLLTGKVRAIGVSNFTKLRIQELVLKTNVCPAVNQIKIHPYLQQPALFDHCRSAGI